MWCFATTISLQRWKEAWRSGMRLMLLLVVLGLGLVSLLSMKVRQSSAYSSCWGGTLREAVFLCQQCIWQFMECPLQAKCLKSLQIFKLWYATNLMCFPIDGLFGIWCPTHQRQFAWRSALEANSPMLYIKAFGRMGINASLGNLFGACPK